MQLKQWYSIGNMQVVDTLEQGRTYTDTLLENIHTMFETQVYRAHWIMEPYNP